MPSPDDPVAHDDGRGGRHEGDEVVVWGGVSRIGGGGGLHPPPGDRPLGKHLWLRCRVEEDDLRRRCPDRKVSLFQDAGPPRSSPLVWYSRLLWEGWSRGISVGR